MKKSFLFAVYLFCFVAGMAAEKHLVPYLTKFFHKPVVSVVLSTYNRMHALPTAVESILNQTFRDFELILIDDGSTDNTWEIIQSYARKDRRIVPLKNNENKGLIYSLNRGLDAARGKYIARMDDDDKSVPYRLERQLIAMEAHPEITVLGASIIGANTIPVKQSGIPKVNNPDEIQLNSYFSTGLNHPTIMIRRDFLERNHIRYNPKYLYAEDAGLYKDILNKGGKISAINEGLLHFSVVSDVYRPPQYHTIQAETFKQVQKEKLAPFFDAPYKLLGAFVSDDYKCILLTQMVEKNPQLKILNQKLLEERQKNICGKALAAKGNISVKHKYWTDRLVINPDGKTFYRVHIPSEKGKIIQEDKKSVTVKWDRWGEETFLKEENGKKWTLKASPKAKTSSEVKSSPGKGDSNKK